MPIATDAHVSLPPLPPRHVPRPRLTSALDCARDVPLIMISAGPGSGKTVLLSEWAHSVDVPIAWFAATLEDNEPRRFWLRVRAAVQASGVSAADELVAGATEDPATASFDALFRDIQRPPARPLVLIIDDAHVLTHAAIVQGLDTVLRSLHPQFQLVLAARSDPLVPLHRYRLAGQVAELRAADLAMTHAEMRAVLAAHGVALPSREFEALAARTEGWTAGVRLSAMRMERAERPADFVAEFAVDQGSVGEYLMDEVLDLLPEPARRTLVETGFLDVVTGDLADAVTGMSGCGEILAELARTNSFVIPLDPARSRFRYHHLLAEILRYLLQRRGSEVSRAVFSRTATWFEEQGDLQSALHWAACAGDEARAVTLLARGVLADAFVHGHNLVQSELVDLLPLSVPEGSGDVQATEISTARSTIAALTADCDSAARALDSIDGEASSAGVSDPELQINSELSVLILGQKAGDEHAVDRTAQRLLSIADSLPRERVRGLQACVLLARAQAQFWDGRHDEVEPLLRDALALAERDAPRSVEVAVLGMVVLFNNYWSRNVSAEEAAQRARELLDASADLTAPLTLELATAWRGFVIADFETMARAVRRALAIAPLEGDLALTAAVAQTRAQLLLASGQVSAAKTVLDAAPQLGPGTMLLQAHRDMLLAGIETSLGRAERALQLLQPYRRTAFAAGTAVCAAKAHLALGDLRGGEDCVRRVLAGPATQVARCTLVDALLCEARIAQLRNDPGRALEMVVRALEIADGDVVIPFMQVADVFASLLARHPTVAERWPAPANGSDGELAVEVTPRRLPRLLEPLTDRERAVLRFLATTMSTAEIADELYLSVNTVKTHLASIYRKLAAGKRREAVLRARELELL
jgi:LuxR family transcriptional regulator, maltose regulon positive regulatory protein